MAYKIQFRRDTTTNWVTKDPVLAPGEMGVDVTLSQFKIGDGVSKWSELPYYSAAGGTTNVAVTVNGADSDWVLSQIGGGVASSGPDSDWVLAQLVAGSLDSDLLVQAIGEVVDARVSGAVVDSDWVLSQITHKDSDIQVRSIQLTNDANVGTLSWNYDESTLDVQVNAVNIQVGQEQVFYGKAQGAIAKGDGVMFVGAQGGHVLFAKADSTSPGFRDEYIIGVAAESIANGVFGFVVSHGKVREINTSAWTEGSILWLSPDQAGVLIDSEPTTPDHSIMFASVLRSHSSEGVLMVRPSFGYHLEQLHDVFAADAVDGDVITWNASAGYWENRAIAETDNNVDSDWVFRQIPADQVDSDWVLRQIPTDQVDSDWVIKTIDSHGFDSDGVQTKGLTSTLPVVEKFESYTDPSGTIAYDLDTKSSLIRLNGTANAVTFNFSKASLQVGEAVSITMILSNGGTANLPTITFGGAAVKWQNNSTPSVITSVNEAVNVSVMRIANNGNSGDYLVLGNLASFA